MAIDDDAAEHLGALISFCLLALHETAHLVAPTSAGLHALQSASGGGTTDSNSLDTGGELSALHNLQAEEKTGLLRWAQAHSTLMQIFGPREPLSKLMRAPLNAPHFQRLAALANHVVASELQDELYFAPLRDVAAFQRQLHAQASLSKAANEGLLLFSMNAKRRSSRRRN